MNETTEYYMNRTCFLVDLYKIAKNKIPFLMLHMDGSILKTYYISNSGSYIPILNMTQSTEEEVFQYNAAMTCDVDINVIIFFQNIVLKNSESDNNFKNTHTHYTVQDIYGY